MSANSQTDMSEGRFGLVRGYAVGRRVHLQQHAGVGADVLPAGVPVAGSAGAAFGFNSSMPLLSGAEPFASPGAAAEPSWLGIQTAKMQFAFHSHGELNLGLASFA